MAEKFNVNAFELWHDDLGNLLNNPIITVRVEVNNQMYSHDVKCFLMQGDSYEAVLSMCLEVISKKLNAVAESENRGGKKMIKKNDLIDPSVSNLTGYAHIHDQGEVESTSTEFSSCNHLNGWRVKVKFWIFSKRIFVCSDCGECIEVKRREYQ